MMRWLVSLAVGAGIARADTPTFVSLDRATGTTNAGAHVGLMLFEDQDSDGGAPNLQQPRLQLYGEYAFTPNVGVVGSTSVIWFRSDPRSKLGLGTTHLGGYGRVAFRGLELVGRASLILPTGTFIPRDSYYEDVAIHGTLFPWLEERAVDADAFWLKLGPSVRYRAGQFAAQLDVLFDIPLSGDIYADDMSRGTPVRMHVGGGIAYALAPWRIGAEVLVSGYHWVDQLYGDLEGDEGVYVGLTLSAARTFSPGREGVVWFSNPLDQYIRSRWHAIGFGFQASL